MLQVCLKAVLNMKALGAIYFMGNSTGCYNDSHYLASNSTLLCVVLKIHYKEGNINCMVVV